MKSNFLKLIGIFLLACPACSGIDAQPEFPAWYPDFSWDKVPVYKMFGDPGLLKDDEVKMIAGTSDFICIEKAHGIDVLGAAEMGAKYEITRFKEKKSGIKALFYFNSARAWPFTTYSQGMKYGEIRDEYKPFILKDPVTGELVHDNKIYCFDVLNPGFRQWWTETVAKGVRETGADGLFVDQMHGYVFKRPAGDRQKTEEAQALMMKMAKEAIGKDKILLLNNAAHIPVLNEIGDAFMFEHYNSKLVTKENIIREWELMKNVSEAGKISVWRIGIEVDVNDTLNGNARRQDIHPDKPDEMAAYSKELLEFYLAAFLAGARENSWFQYGWGWKLTTGSLVDYPEFRKPLGKPEGDCKKESEWIFTRTFQHAKVWVDLEHRKGKIEWENEQR